MKRTYKEIYESVVNNLEHNYENARIFALAHKSERTTLADKDTHSSIDYVNTPYGIFVLSIDTPKEFRGRGGASRLLQQVIKLGDVYLEADASEDNKQEDLERFYLKNGFISIGNKQFVHKKNS